MFLEIGLKLREVLGDTALRIDHIGSTSVVGLDAKPIVDIQISIACFDDIQLYRSQIESVGFALREDNPDLSKRYYREIRGNRRTHIHVRRAGSFAEQMSLLFRDYLREHKDDALRYAAEKHRLMSLYKLDRPRYVEGKRTYSMEYTSKSACLVTASWLEPRKI